MQNELTLWPDNLVQQYRDHGYWQDKTLCDYLFERAREQPENLAMICGERRYTYAEMVDIIHRFSAGFTKLGLQAGDNVVLQMTNVAEFYLCFFALVQKGIRPIMALPAHRYSEIAYFCQHANAKAYIIDGTCSTFNYQALAHDILENNASVSRVIVKGDLHYTDSRFTSLAECLADTDVTQDANPCDIAFFQLSGGTTGAPKLIPRTHNDYAYSVIGSNALCDVDEETRFLCVLPVAHNYPFSSPGALGVFWAGGCVIIGADTQPQTAFRLIEQHKANFVPLVPPLALLWMDFAKTQPYDLSSLKVIQVGGAKFSENAAKRLLNVFNCQLQQVFGMAEGLVNYTRLDDPIEVITQTQGRPISKLDQVRVVNEAGEDVAQGEEGFLITQGPYTIRGYYNAPQHNARSFTPEGFYRTGDIVRQTEQGNIIVTGRDKDQINRGGEKIAAEEIENQLLRHDAVHDAALIAIADDYLGEHSCAVIVMSSTQSIRPIELKRFLRQQSLAEFKIPDQIQFIDELPKTPVGKIDKKKLRTLFSKITASV
ncbi:(2,3-dihydroxybenzoyl)adenylate synthase [Vibrio palustris]|uniref:2,3-dihydroxybenzoate-AMP ligase n=1 Tax=Vibrio palustris TaxID=1918946 RepID=A0A1R4B889_9VIBR|nr:(2,3-dihydroxybenzoyl)adenylate synthase [Vibrio palustris]SJL85124.1 2,3-dihydroxybenzoate-AMP ligase [Vibrio palustris]